MFCEAFRRMLIEQANVVKIKPVAQSSQGSLAGQQGEGFSRSSIHCFDRIIANIITIHEKGKTFKYLVSLVTNRNFTQEEIKCRLKAGNSCYCTSLSEGASACSHV